jgi:hypothetical protein
MRDLLSPKVAVGWRATCSYLNEHGGLGDATDKAEMMLDRSLTLKMEESV